MSVGWPEFATDSKQYLQLGEEIKARDTFDRVLQLELWTELVPAIE